MATTVGCRVSVGPRKKMRLVEIRTRRKGWRVAHLLVSRQRFNSFGLHRVLFLGSRVTYLSPPLSSAGWSRFTLLRICVFKVFRKCGFQDGLVCLIGFCGVYSQAAVGRAIKG